MGYPRRDRSLILHCDPQLVTCFDKPSRKLIHVRVYGDASFFVPPQPGYFLLYPCRKNSELTSNYPIIRSVHEIMVEMPKPEDCIKLERGNIKIYSWVGFSSNPNQLTYSRKVGFSDWYGLVDTSGWQLENDIYKAYIILSV